MTTLGSEIRQVRYERACWWLAQGVAIVPLKPHSKELQPGYGAHKAHITTTDFARRWFLQTDANLGIVLGDPVGIVVGDWDSRQAYQMWRTASGATVDTLTEQTRRGYHLFFSGHDLVSVTEAGFELKTCGVCMVSPSVHPSGLLYQVVNDAPIVALDCSSASVLFPFLSERFQTQIHPAQTIAADEKLSDIQNTVVARIKAARPILDEMSAAGLTFQSGGKTTLVARCPFHRDHTPSLWVNPVTGLWGCNRPDCPAAGIHDVINFRALYRDISNRVAIRQLAAEYLASKPTAMR